MYGPREILNEFRWRDDRDLERAHVWYVHRGAPNDTRIVPGSAIGPVEGTFVQVETSGRTASIPLHRIFRIDYDGNPYWKRNPDPGELVHGPE